MQMKRDKKQNTQKSQTKGTLETLTLVE